ncbi:hypothetical protein K491DRAFT_649748 [Lophiostoma macrostomum CBS 122681]|uniref:Mediator of RNA polymerase II transcription subunit 6 n=1 Tax=Lophiostoma macrostomum CBS 122681 TaxID=1314788 RepID=A0A6A6TMP6_9PLEO|nr:hypothetical protein K491DRAFT_649748 [Lophiostoma macrostomum CBS 122681]
MAPRIPPPDETEFNNPQNIGDFGLGVDANAPRELNASNVLFYFYTSPFFDRRCANWEVWATAIQAHNTPAGMRLLTDPRAFEARVRQETSIAGVMYVVVGEAKEPGEPWVIQRQNMVKNEATGKLEMRVEGTWYIMGTRILMAPSLLDILQTRLLSVSSILQSVFQTSQSLSHWSPSTGHTYLPPSLLSKPSCTAPLPSSRAGSRAGSIVPGSPTHSQSHSQQTTSHPTLAPENQTTSFSDDFFLQSLQLTNRYGHEFMDENPLQGEPGAFVFASTNQQVEARNKAQAAAAAQASAAKGREADGESAANSVAPTPRPAALVGVGGGAGVGAEGRKGSLVGMPPAGKAEKKRRKSRGPGSPMSPTSATSFNGPGL